MVRGKQGTHVVATSAMPPAGSALNSCIAIAHLFRRHLDDATGLVPLCRCQLMMKLHTSWKESVLKRRRIAAGYDAPLTESYLANGCEVLESHQLLLPVARPQKPGHRGTYAFVVL